eukprot:256538-Amorphochlora_amoeboformis.AAC.1
MSGTPSEIILVTYTIFPDSKRPIVVNGEWLKEVIAGPSILSGKDGATNIPSVSVPMLEISQHGFKSKILCEHDKLDPRCRGEMKRIGPRAWDILSSASKIDSKELPEVCLECSLKFLREIRRKEEEDRANDELLELLKEQVKEPNGFWISKTWCRVFRNFANAKKKARDSSAEVTDKDGFKIELPSNMTAEVECNHGRLCVGRRDRRLISERAWQALIKAFQGDPFQGSCKECPICKDEKASEKTKNQERKRKRKREEKEAPQLASLAKGKYKFPGSRPPREGKYYIIPHAWGVGWMGYRGGDGDAPSNITVDELLCEHKRLRYRIKPRGVDSSGTDPEILALVPEYEFEALVERYGSSPGAISAEIHKDSLEWEDLAYTTSPPECEECINNRVKIEKQARLFYTDAILYIQEVTKIPDAPSGTKRRPRRKRVRTLSRLEIVVSSRDTVGMAKMKILEQNDIAPGQQLLYLGEKLLDDNGQTLEELEIEQETTLHLKVDSTKSEDCNYAALLPHEERAGRTEGGFGGSVLTSW